MMYLLAIFSLITYISHRFTVSLKPLIVLVTGVLLLCFTSLAQEKKGDEYLEQKQYVKALKFYEKAIKKQPSGTLFQKAGKAYLYTKNYQKAEEYYQKAMQYDNSNDSSFFEFAKALLVLNHKKEAKKYLERYLEKYPEDQNARLYLNAYDSFFSVSKQKYYSIQELSGGINTSASEFGAIPYNNGILYITEGTPDLVDDDLNQRDKIAKYFDVYYSSKQGNGYPKGKPFEAKINSEWDEGPVAITPDGKYLYYTSIKKFRAKSVSFLYICEITDGKIGKPKAFEYNSKEYSILHPAFSDNGKTLFFSSNKKGGEGGWDIYYCTYKRNYGWSAPKLIGGNINTGGNEVFPHYNKGRLFFASDGHIGWGGLDLYVALKGEYYKNIKNLGEPINSSKDDFAIYYADEKTGFFSSDRTTGKGKDDIYTFEELTIIEKVDTSASISGVFEFRKLGHANVELILYDENGEEVDRVFTDKDGRFIFKKLKSGANYTIKPAGEFEDAELFITNSKGEKILLVDDKKGKFIFKTLEHKYMEDLLPIEIDEPSALIMPIRGYVFRKLEGDLNKRMEIRVYDQDGKLIGRTYTNKDGTFIFKTLTPQNKYRFELMDEEELSLIIINQGEKETLTQQSDGQFVFDRIKGETEGLLLVNENNELIRISQKERFAIKNILYAYNSAELNMDAKIELNKIFMIYRKNKHLKFTIESHTDSRGSDKYNLKLSEKRARKVIHYLEKKGIPRDHLKGIGMGESKLLNHCDDNIECSEEEHAINRRTEVILEGKITKF